MLPLTGLLAEAAFLKAAFYAEHYRKTGREQSVPVAESTTYTPAKSTTSSTDNRPPNHRVVGKEELEVWGVVSQRELEKLLNNGGWQCWSTPIRLKALLLLIADATDRAIMEAAIKSRDADARMDGEADEYVRGRFTEALRIFEASQEGIKKQAEKLGARADAAPPAKDARADAASDILNMWKREAK
jgi:hypothetical protein